MNLTCADTDQFVKLIICLIQTFLGGFEYIGKFIKFGLNSTKNIPNFTGSFLNCTCFESHLEAVKKGKNTDSEEE